MKWILLSSIMVITLLSCSKQDNEPSRMTLLTARPWKWVKVEQKMNNWPWMDEVPFWPDCKKDDETLFKTDHSYVMSQGQNKCDPMGDDIMDIATWRFLENETKFDMDGAVSFIEVLNEQQFIISANVTIGSDTHYYKYTLEH